MTKDKLIKLLVKKLKLIIFEFNGIADFELTKAEKNVIKICKNTLELTASEMRVMEKKEKGVK